MLKPGSLRRIEAGARRSLLSVSTARRAEYRMLAGNGSFQRAEMNQTQPAVSTLT